MIKIVSAAYHMNIGDNRGSVLLQGLIRSWFNKDVVLSGYADTEFKIVDDVHKFCDGAEAIIIGPGGCLVDSNLGKYFYAHDPSLYDAVECPIIICASGFNRDYITHSYSNLWKETIGALLSKVSIGGYRTENDKNLAISLGADKDTSYCCPDPLLFIGSNANTMYSGNNVCVSLYTNRLSQLIESSLSKYDYIPVYSNHESSDFKMSDYINCDFVISKRFHGQILAFAFGKPCFSIESNIKHKFLRQLLYPMELWSYVDNHSADEELGIKFEEFIAKKEMMRNYIEGRRSELKKEYVRFFIELGKIIG